MTFSEFLELQSRPVHAAGVVETQNVVSSDSGANQSAKNTNAEERRQTTMTRTHVETGVSVMEASRAVWGKTGGRVIIVG